jgi:hypothetical protein
MIFGGLCADVETGVGGGLEGDEGLRCFGMGMGL